MNIGVPMTEVQAEDLLNRECPDVQAIRKVGYFHKYL